METEQARANLKNILLGKPSHREPTLTEAKAGLRATDPGIDISRPLKQLNQGNIKGAVVDLAFEATTTITLPYLRPLLTATFVNLYALGTGKDRRKKKSIEFQGNNGHGKR